mmetsp:Transcript_3515/g.7765  ORF Transcript_3515/g.7765 Transcript_3515/m.7765 type:complete len:197 (+) Transcript_3515:81-671(+)|eukprot:CAMPEP_0172313602 /NCGR_PEP_ID=MMETSP1058-20130122/20557_1 /TAXON_ID=83371 /ORGANISM="Detonula confervacea, Strain CCMP 353" /LENGTH=196 /DNA_ID=CAMNT_0013027281 /DNA_START=56 /DNA_END=646 /DNA_ORIENTATION=+
MITLLKVLFLLALLSPSHTSAFSATPSNKERSLYGIPGSGWTSPSWNWGSPEGTGHDCAKICREQYATAQDRAQLIDNLLLEDTEAPRIPQDFEEVKLVLALVWQRYRNDSVGNKSYGVLLDQMADGRFDEAGDDEACSKLLVQEMQKRFTYLQPDVQDKIIMNTLLYENGDDYDLTRRQCSGMVLKAMDFEDLGL